MEKAAYVTAPATIAGQETAEPVDALAVCNWLDVMDIDVLLQEDG